MEETAQLQVKVRDNEIIVTLETFALSISSLPVSPS